jgi:hypothetical protein
MEESTEELEPFATTKDGKPIAAWLFKCDPHKFDIVSVLEQGGGIANWSVVRNYRVDLMQPGQRAYLWVTGSENDDVPPGIWAAGAITGELGTGTWDPENTLDEDEKGKQRLFVGVDLIAIEPVIRRRDLRLDPRFVEAEILRQPQMGNPLVLTPDEVAAIESFDYEVQELLPDVIVMAPGCNLEFWEAEDGWVVDTVTAEAPDAPLQRFDTFESAVEALRDLLDELARTVPAQTDPATEGVAAAIPAGRRAFTVLKTREGAFKAYWLFEDEPAGSEGTEHGLDSVYTTLADALLQVFQRSELHPA